MTMTEPGDRGIRENHCQDLRSCTLRAPTDQHTYVNVKEQHVGSLSSHAHKKYMTERHTINFK